MQKIIRRIPMKKCARTLYKLVDLGDSHLTELHHDFSVTSKAIKTIQREENRYWCASGDLCGLSITSRRNLDSAFAKRPNERALVDTGILRDIETKVIARLLPIKKKCLFILEGNHDYDLLLDHEPIPTDKPLTDKETTALVYSEKQDTSGEDTPAKRNPIKMSATEYVCKRLGVPYGGQGILYCGVIFEFSKTKKTLVLIHARHTCTSSSTFAGSLNNLQKHAILCPSPDIYIGAHDHKHFANIEKREIYDRNSHNIKYKPVMWVRAGNALKSRVMGETTYAELRDYGVQTPGWVTIKILVGINKETDGMDLLGLDANTAEVDFLE